MINKGRKRKNPQFQSITLNIFNCEINRNDLTFPIFVFRKPKDPFWVNGCCENPDFHNIR